jgi:hypothetical protein
MTRRQQASAPLVFCTAQHGGAPDGGQRRHEPPRVMNSAGWADNGTEAVLKITLASIMVNDQDKTLKCYTDDTCGNLIQIHQV